MGSASSSQTPALHKAVEVPNLKIALVGDPQVGKTSILLRYIHNQFSPVYVQTHKAAIENVVRKLNVPGHAKVPITFWDIPGYEDLPLHSSYFTNLDAVIVVVDLSDPTSLESAVMWRQIVLGSASFTDSKSDQTSNEKSEGGKEEETRSKNHKNVEDIPFLLLGNKLDLCMGKEKEINDDIAALTEKGDTIKEKIEENLLVSNRVEQLDKIAGKGFTGGVVVSAHNNDLSVHAAIQTFLRHMLDKQSLVQRKWMARPENEQEDKSIGRPRYQQERRLKLVGIQEIDAKFNQAEEILYRVTSLQHYQEDSLRKFSSQCVDAGIITSSQDASMQNCLVALRDKLVELDLKLQLKLNDEFCHLEVKASKEDAQLDKEIRYAIKTFNKEYAAVTKAILAEFPVAESKLSQIESNVEHLCKNSQEELKTQKSHGGTSKTDTSITAASSDRGSASSASATSSNDSPHTSTKYTSAIHDNKSTSAEPHGGMRAGTVVERNRAVLRHVAHECHDCLAHIQRSVKQAKAAFVW